VMYYPCTCFMIESITFKYTNCRSGLSLMNSMMTLAISPAAKL